MANPLQAFVLTFALEGDDIVAKGLRQMTGESDRLAKSLGGADKSLSDTEKGAKKTGKEIKVTAENFMKLVRNVTAAAAPLLALGVVLNRALNFAQQGEDILFMAQSANTAAQSFQRLANASRMFGGTPQGTAGILAGLNAQIQNMRFGEGSAVQEAAIRYGLRLHGENGLATPQELLENVARRFETLDTASQLDLGRMIGLDEPTIRLLQGGVEGLRRELELAQKYTIFSDKDLENARKFERMVREIKMGFAALWAEISRMLLPVLQYAGENVIRIIDYFRAHADFVKGALMAVSAVLTAIAVKALAAFAPFYAAVGIVAALVAGAALLYDDFMTFAGGGKSALEPLWQLLVDIGRFWQELPNLLKEAVQGMANVFKSMFNPIAALLRVWDKIGEVQKKWTTKKATDWLSKLSVSATPVDAVWQAQRVLSDADDTPLNSINKGDISNTVNNSNRTVSVENNITVNGAGSPAETAEKVSTEINPIFQMVTGAL